MKAKVSTPVEVPDEGDLPQYHTAAGHWEVGRCPQQVGASQGLGEVSVLHDDGAWVQLGHNGLPVSRLPGNSQAKMSCKARVANPAPPLRFPPLCPPGLAALLCLGGLSGVFAPAGPVSWNPKECGHSANPCSYMVPILPPGPLLPLSSVYVGYCVSSSRLPPDPLAWSQGCFLAAFPT